VTVTGNDAFRTATLCRFDELVVVQIVGNNPELAGNLDHVGRGLDESNRLVGVACRMPKLGHKDSAKLFEDWWGDDQVGQAGLNSGEAAIRRSTPEESRHQNVGVQDHPHLTGC